MMTDKLTDELKHAREEAGLRVKLEEILSC